MTTSPTRKELIKRCDRLRQTCARYENIKKKNNEWVGTCITCGRTLPVASLQGGHFISRGCIPLRWDKRNVHCQCQSCNGYKNGAYIEYSHWFIKQYGAEMFDAYVNVYKNWKQGKIQTVKMDELKNIYDHWLKEGRELEKKVGPLFPKTWELFGPDFID